MRVKTLKEAFADWPDVPRLRALCQHCGRQLFEGEADPQPGKDGWVVVPRDPAWGRVTSVILPEGETLSLPKLPPVGGTFVRGPLTGKGRLVPHHRNGVDYLRWWCGCGVEGKRRLDRLGDLPVTLSGGTATILV